MSVVLKTLSIKEEARRFGPYSVLVSACYEGNTLILTSGSFEGMFYLPGEKCEFVHSALPKLPESELRIYLEVLRDAALSWEGDGTHDLEVFFSIGERTRVEMLLAGS
jgi:hypothetical protein